MGSSDEPDADEVELEVRVRPTDPRVATRCGRLAVAMLAGTALHASRLLGAAQGRVGFESAMLGYVVVLAATTIAVLGVGALYDQMAGSLVSAPAGGEGDAAGDLVDIALDRRAGRPAGGPSGGPAHHPLDGPTERPVDGPADASAPGDRS